MSQELIFNVGLPWHQQQLGNAKIKDRQAELVPCVSPPSPAQSKCSQALVKRLGVVTLQALVEIFDS